MLRILRSGFCKYDVPPSSCYPEQVSCRKSGASESVVLDHVQLFGTSKQPGRAWVNTIFVASPLLSERECLLFVLPFTS